MKLEIDEGWEEEERESSAEPGIYRQQDVPYFESYFAFSR